MTKDRKPETIAELWREGASDWATLARNSRGMSSYLRSSGKFLSMFLLAMVVVAALASGSGSGALSITAVGLPIVFIIAAISGFLPIMLDFVSLYADEKMGPSGISVGRVGSSSKEDPDARERTR